MPQLPEILEILEAVYHEQRHKADRGTGELEDEIGEEHLRLVELANLNCRCVHSSHNQTLVACFIIVANQHFHSLQEFFEEFFGEDAVFLQPQVDEVTTHAHRYAWAPFDILLKQIHKLSREDMLAATVVRHQAVPLLLMVDLHVGCADKHHLRQLVHYLNVG